MYTPEVSAFHFCGGKSVWGLPGQYVGGLNVLTASSSSKGQGSPSIGNNQVSEKIPDKQKSREARVLAKQKSREGRVRKQKRTLERKDKQERITSRKKSL